MSLYCQKCGGELEQEKLCAALWIAFYKCGACGQSYMEVADSRWIYPLQFLSLGLLEKVLAASEEQLKSAALRIEAIDHKTVSIVAFEKALSQAGESDSSRAT